MIKVVVNGYKGRMGNFVIDAVNKCSDMELVGKADQGDDLSEIIKKGSADVVVDFTVPEVRMKNFKTIVENGARPVVGTTGYTEDDIKALSVLCNEAKIGAIIAPNFTIGAILMMRLAAEAAKYMDYAEVIEYHHENKVDFPSGTAVKTAQMLAEVKDKYNQGTNDKVANMEGARGAEYAGVRVHSVRMPGYVAHQEVIFGATGQTLTIRHDSISRESYMPGVMMSCRKVMEVNELIYGLEKIL